MTGRAPVVRPDVVRPDAARRSPRLPALAVSGLLLLLAGCGTGQDAQTYQEKASMDSSNDAIGDLAVRNLAVAAPREGTTLEQGADAPMSITVVNDGGNPDTLVSASAQDVAASVDVVGGSGGSGGSAGTMQVPALGSTGTRYSLVLRSLLRPLETGTYVDVTLRFQRNGEKTLLVPVQVTNSDDTLPKEADYKVAEVDSNGNPLSPE